MPLQTPFRLGPFVMDAHGRLEPGDASHLPSFRMAWRGCPVHARFDESWEGQGATVRLVLSAVVGRVPSTAGGDAARNLVRRAAAFAALQRLGDGTAALRMRLLADHRVVVEESRAVNRPVSAIDLLTESTCFLLDLGPYLDVLAEDEVLVAPADGSASNPEGIVKT